MKKHNTSDDFITAFWQLYEKNPIEKISINQLCQIAGYNRATFYNHFNNIYDLLDKAVSNMLAPVKDDVLRKQNIYNLLQENLTENIIFSYFSKQNKYIELLFKRRDYYILAEQVKREFLLHISENISPNSKVFENIEILFEYQLSAVFGVINYWYKTGKTLTEQAILQKIYDISSTGFIKSLKEELKNIYEK